MDPTKQVDAPITVPTEEEQEQVVGGAAIPFTIQHHHRPPTAPPDQTNQPVPARWDPHPPILGR